jgi:predicted transcriptional regulator YheO
MRANTKMVKLSAAEKAIIASHAGVLDGFAAYFGGGYEFVLHTLESLDHSVIKIVNGHHTGRSVGAPITDLALTMLAELEAKGDTDHISYATKTSRGDPLHSTTIAIRGDKQRIIGLLCINFYLNTPLSQVFQDLFRTSLASSGRVQEHFSANVEEAIAGALEIAKRRADAAEGENASLRNKRIIGDLCEQGIFQLKGAAPAVADLLGLSRNTVYLHLRSFERGAPHKKG